MRIVIGLLGLLMLSGCAQPGDGPTAVGFEQSIRDQYPVRELTQVSLPSIQERDQRGLAPLGGRKFNQGVLRSGDLIEVTVFDKTEEGMMSAADSKRLDLGRFRVDDAGYVNLPYVGRTRAAGSSPGNLQDRIVSSLRGSAVSPQASVSVVEQGGAGFTVNGAVHSAQRFQLSSQSERVLDAIAMAGGPTAPAGETTVTLVRGSSRASVPMDRLVAEPAQNIRVQPNDQILLRRDATSFTSLGAFKSPGEFNFQPGELTMAQAVARSGGLLDSAADPSKVYLLRREEAANARSVGMIPANDTRTGTVPVAYLVDMTKTQSLFVMQSLKMRDGDMLYVPNTTSTELAKPFQVFERTPTTAAAPLPQ